MSDFNFFKKIFPNSPDKQSNLLVIEVSNDYLQATFLKADFENKNILVCGNWIKKLESLEVFYLLGEIKRILKKIPKSDFAVIFNLDSSLSSTIYSSVLLIRPKPKELINEGDLDNLISQATWKVFDKHRFSVSKKLEIGEVDVLLSDVRIHSIKIDGHKVVNPIGFNAKSLEVHLSETFMAKDLIRGLHEIIPANKIVLINESGIELSRALFSANGNEPVYLADMYPKQTKIFQASLGYFCYLGSLNWGGNCLFKNLEGNLKLDEDIAKKIMEIYIKKNSSLYFAKRIENYLIEECRVLANGIESLAAKPRKIFLNPYFDLPVCLVSKCLESRFGGGFKIQLLSTELIMKNTGFKVQFNKLADKVRDLAILFSSLSDLSLNPQNEKVSYLANRRARWILS